LFTRTIFKLYSPTKEQHSVYSVDKHVRHSLQQEQFCT